MAITGQCSDGSWFRTEMEGKRQGESDGWYSFGSYDAGILGNKNGLPKAKVAANHIRKAINKVLVEKKHLTQDLGGTAGTKEMTSAIIEAME